MRMNSKRDDLVNATIRLALKQTFTMPALNDIALEAGVPLGNVYYYFKTKDDLIEAVLATATFSDVFSAIVKSAKSTSTKAVADIVSERISPKYLTKSMS